MKLFRNQRARLMLKKKNFVHVPLKMRDKLSNGDLLCHLVVKILTVEHHGLQDRQGALQHCRVHGRLVHEAGNLKKKQGKAFRESVADTVKFCIAIFD